MTRKEARNELVLWRNRNSDNCYHYKFVEALTIAIKALEQESKWVPISERLPEEYADVICCTDAEEVFIATYLGKMNDGVDCFDDNDGMMWEGDVIAWMPLPEPYKAESEEEI